MLVHTIAFYSFALVLLFSASMVIASRNTVNALLFLVLAFFASSALWLLIEAEFLALVLLFLYIGAVMTLFLFVVMMLNLDISVMREQLVRYVPIALLVTIVLVALMLFAINPVHSVFAEKSLTMHGADYSNTKAMGELLFTQYRYPVDVAAAILLVAIISAIALAFRGRKANTKAQRISEQQAASKANRLRLVKNMKAQT